MSRHSTISGDGSDRLVVFPTQVIKLRIVEWWQKSVFIPAVFIPAVFVPQMMDFVLRMVVGVPPTMTYSTYSK